MAPRVTKAQLQEALAGSFETTLLLTERISELELALENGAWTRLSGDYEREFSREGLKEICRLARLYYLKNPLIQRGVNVQRDYVFGQGVTIQANDADVDDVVQAFLDDAKNQAELTSHQALLSKEVALALSGNIFFVFFPNVSTGQVRVRTLPVDEVVEIITNPEDAKDPWFYKRVWTANTLSEATGQTQGEQRTAYYPDWRHRPTNKAAKIGEHPVQWDTPVYHIKVGGLDDMRFGVPEVYAALDWAKAYKSFLEDWATIVRAYSRFAWQLTTKGGRTGIAAAKARLATTLGTGSAETNPAPVTASTFIAGDENTKMTPMRTAGATTSAEDGRRLLLMVAATMGFPETFWGDADVGTLATAKSLDRPSELKISSRQSLWRDVLGAILEFVIYWAVKAHVLPGSIDEEDDGTPRVELAVDPETGEPKSASVEIIFPPVIEHSVKDSVDAIVAAWPVLGKAGAQNLSRLLLSAIGVDDVEAAMDELYDEDGEPRHVAPPPVMVAPAAPGQPTVGEQPPATEEDAETPPQDAEEAKLLEAVRNVSRWLAGERSIYANGH